MRILSVASECAPFVKTGGLADVVGALPAALAGKGIESRVLLPGYPAVMRAAKGARRAMRWDALQGGPARLLAATVEGVALLVLDAPHLYDRPGNIYMDPEGLDWPDNPARFAALCRAAADIAAGGMARFRPDLVHCHDWQAGLAPYYIAREGSGVPTVMTIHNIAFGGPAPAEAIETLGIDRADFTSEGLEFWGRVSALKAGLVWADRISTVSPTYATELRTPEFGMGFDGVIRRREGDLWGILNGIDTEAWNPAADAHAIRYSSPKGKGRATRALRGELGLPASDGPLAVVISRLTEQKGLDLLLRALPAFLEAGGQLALLGSGDRGMEQAWRAAAEAHPGVAVTIGYDEPLSHRMLAGGDAILVPSRFEPCGLTQLYGLRYGTIPVVARTGGLADTVIDANDAAVRAKAATGIVHAADSADAVALSLVKLVALHGNSARRDQIQRNAMRHPVGWDASASRYAALYRSLVPLS